MKKIFTLLMALSLVAGYASANVFKLASPKHSAAKASFEKRITPAAPARKAVAATNEAIALQADAVDAIYLSNYWSVNDFLDGKQPGDYPPVWVVEFANSEDTTAYMFFQILTPSREEIAGSYIFDSTAFGEYSYGNGAHVLEPVGGTFDIEYVNAINGVPTYRFHGSFTDSLQVSHEFDYTLAVEQPLDYGYYNLCYYYQNWSSYQAMVGMSYAEFFSYWSPYPCSLEYVELLDAPTEPLSGEIIEVPMTTVQVWDNSSSTVPHIVYQLSNMDDDGNGYEATIYVKGSDVVASFADTAAFFMDYTQVNENGNRVKLQSLSGQVSGSETEGYAFEFNAGNAHGGITYHITGTFSHAMDPAYQFDSEEDLEKEFTEILVADSTASYGILDILLSTADLTTTGTGYEAEIYLYAEAAAEGSIIPVGVYPINSTREFGTVMASKGYIDGYDMPLYVNEYQNQQYADSWYVVSGTVTVTYENNVLELTVDGTNYMGASVYLHYVGNAPTGIEEVVVDGVEGVKKQLIDGHMVIVKDGQAFNVLGARVK